MRGEGEGVVGGFVTGEGGLRWHLLRRIELLFQMNSQDRSTIEQILIQIKQLLLFPPFKSSIKNKISLLRRIHLITGIPGRLP